MKAPGPVTALCCDFLCDEVGRALAMAGVPVADILTYPATCHLACGFRPVLGTALLDRLRGVDNVLAVCGRCLGPQERDALAEVAAGHLKTQGAAELLAGKEVVSRAHESGAFVALPGWVTRWRHIVQEDWGFDQATAREFFAECHDRILYLSSDEASGQETAAEVEALAEFVGLPVERRVVSLEQLALRVGWEAERMVSRAELLELREQVKFARAAAAEQAMLVEFVAELGNDSTEGEVQRRLIDTMDTLFAPREVTFEAPRSTERPHSDHPNGPKQDRSEASRLPGQGASFRVLLRHRGLELGELTVHDVMFPEFVDGYLSTAVALADAAALGLSAARLLGVERALAAQLRTHIEEMDTFVHVVSHDLKEPLRAILGFGELLQSSHAEALSGEGQEFLDHILGGARKGQRLIADLSKLARIGRQHVDVREIDLDALVEGVVCDLAHLIGARSATVDVAPLGRVMGSAHWIQTVFHNLIVNGIKYNHSDAARIEVGIGEPMQGDDGRPMAVLFVRDNGVGIEPRFHERVFDLFRRLVPRRLDDDGTGAGLAIVRKVVEQEGGRIWLESAPGAGSTFSFTLPLADR